ncbi:MAG: haloacid dehalogenase-like hydrolase [Anaerotruncus sp.]|nr:MAG: haloacid dehalogenase-like hydrolase [Anaerotruncus sp.]
MDHHNISADDNCGAAYGARNNPLYAIQKNLLYIFLPLIPLQKAVCGFWNRHEKQLYQWFFERKRKGIVISASPDFLLEEISKRAGFDYLICTEHSRKTGMIIGENCRGEEKG